MNIRTLLLLLLALLCGAPTVRAQDKADAELFLPAELPADTQLPSDLGMGKPFRAVRINLSVWKRLAPGQTVTLRLLDNTTLTLRIEREEKQLHDVKTFVGRLTGGMFSLFIMSVCGDAGALHLDMEVGPGMQLRYLKNGIHLLCPIPQEDFRCKVQNTQRLPDSTPSGIHIQAVNTIETVSFATQAAINAAGGNGAMRSRINNTITYTNTAFSNSNGNAQLRLMEAYILNLDESGTQDDVLARFEANSTANYYLDVGKVDIVTLFISHQRGSSGVSRTPNRHLISYYDGNYERTYAHEMGHCIGCGHEPGDQFPNNPSEDGGVYSYSYAYSFWSVGQYFISIMSYGKNWDQFSIRRFMPHYSNPSVSYYVSPGIGGATGTGTRNNARSIRDYGPIAASKGEVGTEVYVDPANQSDVNGSAAFPFRTIQQALAACLPGSTIYIRGGNYNIQPTIDKDVILETWPGTGVTQIGAP